MTTKYIGIATCKDVPSSYYLMTNAYDTEKLASIALFDQFVIHFNRYELYYEKYNIDYVSLRLQINTLQDLYTTTREYMKTLEKNYYCEHWHFSVKPIIVY